MYLLIFTCLNVRAVHIELVPDMNTYTLVLAIIRFTNIYGVPTHIYSDNTKSFIAGCDVMKEIFLASEFCEHYSKFNIKHIRIPAYSAWVGTTWERMIRVIKSCLYKVLGRATVGYYKLLTILSDVQNAVNSRPLTYRCSDDSGLEIITPNCFIKPYVNDSLLFHSSEESILTSGPPCRKKVNESLANRDKLLEQFRTIWYEEYLISLREQWKDLHEVNFNNRLKVDDVVLVKGPPDKKRPYWHLGRVLEVVPGDDGKVRSAKIKRADGEIAHHSLNHLYPMELALTHNHVAKEPDHSVDQRASESSNLVNPSVNQSEAVALETTGENLVCPDDTVNQDLVVASSEPSLVVDDLVSPGESVNQDLVAASIESSSADTDLVRSSQSLNIPVIEDCEDLVDSVANSHLVDDQIIDQALHTEVNNSDQNLVAENVLLGRVGSQPSVRPKSKRRAAAGRGRPMDDQFIYYD